MRKHVLLVGVILFWPAASRAANTIQPLNIRLGLWETMTVNNVQNAGLPSDKPNQMPPDQRSRAQALMNARIPGGPGARARRSCLTKESLDKYFQVEESTKTNCRTMILKSTDREQMVREMCMDPKERSNSDIHIEVIDPTHVKGSVRGMTMSASVGHPMMVNYTFTSRWLGPDCSQSKDDRRPTAPVPMTSSGTIPNTSVPNTSK